MFRTRVAVGLFGVSLLVAACGGSSSSTATTHKAAATRSSATGVSVSTAKGAAGTYLTGTGGQALYLWEADSNGKSVCSGACTTNWPPLITKKAPVASSGVTAAELGTIIRSDGSKQVTYNGHPLYYYAGDSGSGSTNGQGSDGFGAKWWLVAPTGKAITQSTSSGSSSSSY
jgi:predicted lipoprotein with Yx(FWY)xxD motif